MERKRNTRRERKKGNKSKKREKKEEGKRKKEKVKNDRKEMGIEGNGQKGKILRKWKGKEKKEKFI